jgi:hypothetical protein
LLAGVIRCLPRGDKVEFGANPTPLGACDCSVSTSIRRSPASAAPAGRGGLACCRAVRTATSRSSPDPACGRYSTIDNDFAGPAEFVAPSMFWDWEKLDAGLRVGIVRGTDLTIEFARNRMTLLSGKVLEPDELLATLRFML